MDFLVALTSLYAVLFGGKSSASHFMFPVTCKKWNNRLSQKSLHILQVPAGTGGGVRGECTGCLRRVNTFPAFVLETDKSNINYFQKDFSVGLFSGTTIFVGAYFPSERDQH